MERVERVDRRRARGGRKPGHNDLARSARRSDARRILIVDDNRDAAEVLADALRAAGHVTLAVFEGPSALTRALEFVPEVVLLDIGLPVMDGFEVAARLLVLPGLEGTKVVAVTGYGQPSDYDRTRAAGFHGHIVKPVSVDQIERSLADLFVP